MSDICLLIAGVLTKEHTPAPNSLYKSGIAIKEGDHKSKVKSNLLPNVAANSRIIPPEFIESNENYQVNSLKLTPKSKKLLDKIIGKTHYKVSFIIVESKHPRYIKEDSFSSCTEAKENSSICYQSLPKLDKKDLEQKLLMAKRGLNRISAGKIANISNNSLPTLRFGQSGLSVKVLQRLLQSNGYAIGADGFFGVLTETAVKAFQSQRNVVEDGIVGQVTWGELTENNYEL